MSELQFKQYFKYILINIAVAAIIFILVINYVASAYKINGHSMDTTLKDKDRIIISKLDLNNIERYDIIVFRKTEEPGRSFIKRVVGLSKEKIEIRNGVLYINSKKISHPIFNDQAGEIASNINMKPYVIPDNHYFVMGDNFRVSTDSRDFGAVPSEKIYGKAILRYWPLSSFGKIK
jgi:signal peptidase I